MWILRRIHHIKRNYYRNVYSPSSVLLRAAAGIDKISEYFKDSAEILSMAGRYRQNP